MKYRNWIEEKIGKQYEWGPMYYGTKGGRPLYEIIWKDGTSGDYFIDFENKTIEKY